MTDNTEEIVQETTSPPTSDSVSTLVLADKFKEDSSLGLEDVRKDDLPIPTLRLVQKSSDEATLVDGSKADTGDFYFGSLSKSWKSPEVIFLKAKKIQLHSKYKNVDEDRWAMLGVMPDLDYAPFMLFTPVTSNKSAASFIASVIASKRPIFSFKVKLESREIDGDKGKYYIISFKNFTPIDDEGEYKMLKDITLSFQTQLMEPLVDPVDPDKPEVITEEEKVADQDLPF